MHSITRFFMRISLAAVAIGSVHDGDAIAYPSTIAAFASPTGYSITPSNGGRGYGFTSSATNWTIGQWDSNEDLGAFQPIADPAGAWDGFMASARSASVEVINAGGTSSQVFSQDGTLLPCLTPAGLSNEFDLFAAPNRITGPSQVNAHLSPVASRNGNLLKLSNMAALISAGIVQITSSRPPSALSCQQNMGGAMISIVLANTAVSPAQYLFYQLKFDRVCEPGPSYVQCSNFRPFYYANGIPTTAANGSIINLQYGMGDDIRSFGIPLVTSDMPFNASFNLLPRLVSVIQSTGSSMDHNVADWSLGGFYLGQHIWGDIAMTSEFTGFIPIIVPLHN